MFDKITAFKQYVAISNQLLTWINFILIDLKKLVKITI